jgi:ABC-type phosphate transport system substrate-binding protein
MKNLLSTLILSCTLIAATANAEVAVIVHKDNVNTVSKSDIKRMFLGKMKKYSDGSSVTPVYLSEGNATRAAFEKMALKKSNSQIKAYWSKHLFSGKGNPPKQLTSDTDVLSLVGTNANVIGYIDAASVNDSVKVIANY